MTIKGLRLDISDWFWLLGRSKYKYRITSYEYYSGTWHRYDSENFYLEGNNIVPESMDGVDVSSVKILEASSDKLVIETTGEDEDGSFYDKYTYTRMAE